MSTFSDLGHADLKDDLDHEVDLLDVLGPVAPIADVVSVDPTPEPQTEGGRPETVRYWLAGELVEHPAIGDAGREGAADASGWYARMLERQGGLTAAKRERTAIPAPDQSAAPVDLSDPDALDGKPADFAALAAGAGYAVAATLARGPLSVERSPCSVCGTWERITDGGKLTKHATPGGECPGTELDDDGRCATCGRKTRALKRGGLAKHDRLAVACENVEIAVDAPAWQTVDSVVVRAVSPGGHRIASSWINRGDGWEHDGSAIALAGDRRRPILPSLLEATLKRIAAAAASGAPSAPEPAPAGVVMPPEPVQAVTQAPSEAPVVSLTPRRGLYGAEYVGDLVEHVEARNCAGGCRMAASANTDGHGPGGTCRLLARMYDERPMVEMVETPDGVFCRARKPLESEGAA